MGRARIRAGLDECPVLKLLLALTHEPLQVNQSLVSYTSAAVAFVSENRSRTFAKMAKERVGLLRRANTTPALSDRSRAPEAVFGRSFIINEVLMLVSSSMTNSGGLSRALDRVPGLRPVRMPAEEDQTYGFAAKNLHFAAFMLQSPHQTDEADRRNPDAAGPARHERRCGSGLQDCPAGSLRVQVSCETARCVP